MQFHSNGFRTGDPHVAPAHADAGAYLDEVDVLIVGCGPAGLTLAAQLCAFSDISVCIVERKSGPLKVGQADGIACRSIEMFEALGFSEKVIKEGYWVNEVCFWRPGPNGSLLERAERIQDVEDDLSEMPHVILSQARIHDFLLEVMGNSPRRLEPRYNRELVSLDRDDDAEFPISAVVACVDRNGETERIRAKFVVGCDGARSKVREVLGHRLKGTSARQLWGVMDVLPITDFPDIRMKCAIQSAEQGSILIIPREGGHMVRLYIELDALEDGERAADRGVTPEELVEKARAILSPYEFEAAEVAWWSAYEIGQRVCDQFDDVSKADRGLKSPRIFIAGDACHTHSPKAGQGMNVSMADAFNIGWKLAAVVRRQSPVSLLETYSQERRATAKELIDFDRDMARLFSEKPASIHGTGRFQDYFKKHGRYTAGVETRYQSSLVTGDEGFQKLAAGYPVGKRFHSAPVVRLADAKPMQLGHVLKADGRWRIVVFAPQIDPGSSISKVTDLCGRLMRSDCLLNRVTRPGDDIDSVVDVRAVFPFSHRDMELSDLHELLRPSKGRLGLTDYEKAFCSHATDGDIYDMRGIDREDGATLVVRPDQYVSMVLPISDVWRVEEFFDQILLNSSQT